jgi:predicted nucleic acid-binding protein
VVNHGIGNGDREMKIYLDNCCYNRPYDDQQQIRIFLEAQAKLHIQQLIVDKELEMVSSFILRFENRQMPNAAKSEAIANFFENAIEYIGSDEIVHITPVINSLIVKGIKMKDAAHLACAIRAKCDYFITTDDKLIKRYNGTEIAVRTPITFLQDLEEIRKCVM